MGEKSDSVVEGRKSEAVKGGFSFTVFNLRMNLPKTNVMITACLRLEKRRVNNQR